MCRERLPSSVASVQITTPRRQSCHCHFVRSRGPQQASRSPRSSWASQSWPCGSQLPHTPPPARVPIPSPARRAARRPSRRHDQVRQGARRRLGRVSRVLAVPAHVRPAARHQRRGLRLRRRDEPDRRRLRHDPVAGAPDERCPDRGKGINPTLLGTVSRNDLPGLGTVQQVTYARDAAVPVLPDEEPGETEGANLFDPVTSPTGTWYLVDPSRGRPATGTAQIDVDDRTARRHRFERDGGRRADEQRLQPVPERDVPRLHAEPRHAQERVPRGVRGRLLAACADVGRPEAGPGIDQHALGIIVRPDGTHQVTYNGRPLYLFSGDAYISVLGGTASINGAGANTPFGVFNTIPPYERPGCPAPRGA